MNEMSFNSAEELADYVNDNGIERWSIIQIWQRHGQWYLFWQSGSGSSVEPANIITHALSPYAVVATDKILYANTAGGTVNFTLADSLLTLGRSFRFVDTGHAGTHQFTITPETALINGDSSLIVDVNNTCIDIGSEGTCWQTNMLYVPVA